MINIDKLVKILRIPLQKGRVSEVEQKRIARILEAMRWESGSSLSFPRKHVVARTPDNKTVYFLKPGKEAYRAKPNPYDMTPVVNATGISTFDDIWKYLSKISVYDFEIFRVTLVLIYRCAYMLEHEQIQPGIYRYMPSEDILKCLSEMNKALTGIVEFGLYAFLHFLDILGWNEDMKYHVEDGKPTFNGNYEWRTGRINTLLTCINIPYKTYLYVNNIIVNASTPQKIDWSLVYDAMQTLARARGICTPRQQDLLKWLAPYVYTTT